ncbi:glucan 1,4-alpha-maltotetraohydrolase domain-containing protein [Pseudomonas sp. Marseille-Q5117]|uniref:glucan 1,4-alpha-maltotetraohydrolase domain-containing protein n=1 Tax=Pseudomonas sp. Marseille-Q5117 TaxID=2972777 RepID=UPI0021C9B091|nr:glucan 1,4-alpha-maltotetraohydrolase domain-containing protein [Pseudomonas sp. Marseille-Q5117]
MKWTSLPSLMLFLFLNICDAAEATVAVRNGSGEEVLLQGFHWNSSRTPEKWYAALDRMASTIGNDGFTLIWMPPPWVDESRWQSATASGGGEGYFWQDFNKSSRYGTAEQLKQTASALNNAGVKVVYDVVPNHMSEKGVVTMFPRGRNEWRHDCARCDEGDPFMDGTADLNTGNAEVFETFKKEFTNLRDQFGAQGLRFDFVRGYAPETVDRWMKDFGDRQFCVGEMWKGPNEYPQGDWRRSASWQDALKDWSDRSHCTVFDFALKERMQNGTLAQWRDGLNGNPDPSWRQVAVTFVDNHDTGYSPGDFAGQHHWPLAEERRNQAYAYILSSPGTPTVYWPDMYDWNRGPLIRQLIKLRKNAGVRADSPIRFHTRYSGLVATISGSRKSVVIALGSDLERLPTELEKPALEWDAGAIRIWSVAAHAAPVSLRLNCDNAHPQRDESVYAVGSTLELGAWDPRHALALSASDGRWSASIEIPARQAIEWKCIVRSSDPSGVVYWQANPNTSVTTGTVSETTGRF